MAKRFGGFTPEQLGRIVPEMSGMQADEQSKFLASNPGAAARVGAMTERARMMVEQPVGMAEGGIVAKSTGEANWWEVNGQKFDTLAAAKAATPQAQAASILSSVTSSAPATTTPAADPTVMNQSAVQQTPAETKDLMETAVAQPGALVSAAPVTLTSTEQAEAGVLDAGVGQISETAPQATLTEAAAAGTVEAPKEKVLAEDLLAAGKVYSDVKWDAVKGKYIVPEGYNQLGTPQQAAELTPEEFAAQSGLSLADFKTTGMDTATVRAEEVAPAVEEVVSKLEAATGKPSADAIAEAQTMSADELSQLGISPAQLDQAVQVQAPAARTVQAGELIQGPTVDMQRVAQETNFAAATGVPSTEATVQGQLTKLMSDFEGKEPPAWAAGALRAATAAMAQRGIVGSSIAGQAIVQAAMESALPIAQADAATRASFEAQNLSNRQQTALFAAQQRANFLGIEFDQAFQTRVQNAARISDIANINFTAEQQIALENARLTQTVDLANLNNRQAKIMADVATMAQMDMTNLNNRQQTAVQNAQAFLQMDMTNLDNEQQAVMFQAQSRVQALLSDQAAVNAAAQFNASSENQVNQFFSELSTQISQFNADQTNAMERFNAGEANALDQFNINVANQREQFNAANSLIIEQANAQWYQTIATIDNATINQINRDKAAAQNSMTQLGFSAYMQEARDIMSFSWQSANNDADRATTIAATKIDADAKIRVAQMEIEAAERAAKAKKKGALAGLLGKVAGAALAAVPGIGPVAAAGFSALAKG